MKKSLLFFSLFLILLFIGCTAKAAPDSSAPEHVYSHRGASGEETEHTTAAYDLAILYGSKYIEQDIVVSRDGTLYVSHDLSAERLTGLDLQYSELTDDEIGALETTDGYHILRLSEVFDRYGGEDVTFVIELKSREDALDPFIELVDAYGYQDRIIVQCYQADVLEALEAVYPDMPKLLLCADQESFDAAIAFPYVDILSVNKSLMTEDNCAAAHAGGKQFNVWTLNSMEEIRQAIRLDVDTYFTNYTAKALALENKYR